MNLAVAPSAGSPRLLLIGVTAALAAALCWFVSHKLHYLLVFSRASYSEYYWPRRFGLALHLTGGALAIAVGLVQI